MEIKDIKEYSRQFSNAIIIGMPSASIICEAFMQCASDKEMDMHFRASFPKLSSSLNKNNDGEIDPIELAEMYARVFSRTLNQAFYAKMARESHPTQELVEQLESFDAPYFKALLKMGLD